MRSGELLYDDQALARMEHAMDEMAATLQRTAVVTPSCRN